MEMKMNLVPLKNELPPIFMLAEPITSISTEVVHSAGERWVEFIAHLSQFNQQTVPEAESDLKDILAYSPAEQQAAIYAGIGRCYLHEGKLLESARMLNEAYSLINDNDMNTTAFVLLEMTSLLSTVRSHDTALSMVKTAQQITSSTYLRRIGKYYEWVIRARMGNTDALPRLERSGEYFLDNNLLTTYAYHLKNIGNIHSKNGNFSQAHRRYDEALSITHDENLPMVEEAIMHDLGMLHFRQGNTEQAIQILTGVYESAISHYTRSYTGGNIGFIHNRTGQTDQVEKWFSRALEISENHGVFHLIPGICYHLGTARRRLSGDQDALPVFEKGYLATMELTRRHFPLMGERLMVIEAYTDTLRNVTRPADHEKEFEFAVNRTMKEIRATFHDTVLREFLKNAGSVKGAVTQLKIGDSTFSKIRNRASAHKICPAPKALAGFVQQHLDKDWAGLNQIFERELFDFLLSEYGNNKREMARKLDVNYTRLVAKMNELKRVTKD